MMKHARTLFAVTALTLVSAVAADAGAIRSGATVAAIAGLVRGNAVAYDSINKVYLVVGSHGVLRGRFVQADGTPIGAAFQIQANAANFGHFPRVAFSPDADGGAGGFLVTWHEGAPSVHGRMVSFGKNGAFGNDTQLTADVSWWEAGAPVAYSTVSKEFLVAWRSLPFKGGPASNDIRAVRVDNTATPRAAVFNITNDVHYNDNPSIAYNPAADEFLVVYTGYHDAGGFAYVDALRVQAGTGAALGAVTRLVQTGGTYITDVSYNSATGQYLASWYALPAGAALGRLVNADASLSGNIIALSTRWKAYDALSIAYNRRTDTFFMISHGPTAEDGGVEIASNGTPVDNGFVVTAARGRGNFYPRLAASRDDPNWLISTANNFTTTMVQLVAGTASAGSPTDPTPGTPTTPAPAPTPAPPAPRPAPLTVIDTPTASATVSTRGFFISGWALDRGAASGTGVDFVHVYAWPVGGGNPTFLGAAAMAVPPRPDVGNAYGSQFTAAGYSLTTGPLAAGTYDIAVYAHSTVNNAIDGRLVRVTAVAPVSTPRMWVDSPAANQNTSQNLSISGWALDLSSSATAGVNAIHVYAYPASGAAPIFVGAATHGIARPDVGAAFGGSRFNASGFHLNATLAPGSYTLVVFARSSVADAFNNAQAVPITVR